MPKNNDTFSTGKFVYLRMVKPEDSSLIFRWKQDPLIREMALGYDHETTVEAELEDIHGAIKSESQDYFIVVHRETDDPLGYIRINWMDNDKKFAWLRFAMAEQRRKGYMKDALQSMLTRLFEEGLHRVDAETFAPNVASQRLLKSLGFVQEGVKREAYFDGTSYSDMLAFGLIRSDFIS